MGGWGEYVMLLCVLAKYRKQKLMYIKLLVYLFFYMALGLNDFDAGKSITRAIGRGGPFVIDVARIKIITSCVI
jgi:hypothetical protein